MLIVAKVLHMLPVPLVIQGRNSYPQHIYRSIVIAMSWLLVLVVLVGGLLATTAASSRSTTSMHTTVSGGRLEAMQHRRRFPFMSKNPLSSLNKKLELRDVSTTTNVNRNVKIQNASSNISPMQSFVETILNARRHLMAAAVARSTSIFIMYPADVIKTRLQMQQMNALRITGLFNGVAGSLVGQVPYGVLTFGSYEVYKSYFLDHLPSTIPPIFKYAVAAVFGDLTGSGWLCPSEVIKQKVQAGIYPSTLAAISSIWKRKGVIGFYEGYFGGVARDVPFRVAQLTTYELTKNLYIRIKRQRQQNVATTRRSKSNKLPVNDATALTPGEAAFCGAVAGSFSAAITAPLDRIKTLLMTNSAAYGGTVVSCATKIWTEEGIRGLTTGVIPRVVYIAPSVAIFFVAYEMTQQRLLHWQVSTASNTQ